MTKEKWLWTGRSVVPLLLFVLIFAGAAFAFAPAAAEAEELRFKGVDDDWDWDWTWEKANYDFHETVHYARLEEISFRFDYPEYTDFTYRESTCAVIAGSELIGYYDRYYVDLIPNFTPGIQWSWGYVYGNVRTSIWPLQQTLYTLMDTGNGGSGTTKSGFDKGIKTYVEGQGYQQSYQEATYPSGGLNFNAVKQLLDAKIPVTLFLVGFNLTDYALDFDNNVEIGGYESTGNHAMNARGYTILRYYDDNDSMFREDLFLEVSTDLVRLGGSYLFLGRNMKVAHAMGVEIY